MGPILETFYYCVCFSIHLTHGLLACLLSEKTGLLRWTGRGGASRSEAAWCVESWDVVWILRGWRSRFRGEGQIRAYCTTNTATIQGSESGLFCLPIKELKGTKISQGQRVATGEISDVTDRLRSWRRLSQGWENTLSRAHLEKARQRPSAKQRRVSGA